MSIQSLFDTYFRRFLKFGIVGVSGTIVDFTITWLFRDVVGLYDLVANAIGFTVAATTNYILNRIWTWRSQEKNVGVEYLKFFAVSTSRSSASLTCSSANSRAPRKAPTTTSRRRKPSSTSTESTCPA